MLYRLKVYLHFQIHLMNGMTPDLPWIRSKKTQADLFE